MLARRPWGRELLLFLVAYGLYSLGRLVAIGDVGVATDNAHSIVDLEQSLGVDVEQGVQDFFDGSLALWVLNHLYLAAQLVVVPGALVVLYRRSRSNYVLLRNTVLATWLIALPVYALFPVAPPRLADIGLVDTITDPDRARTGLEADDLALQPVRGRARACTPGSPLRSAPRSRPPRVAGWRSSSAWLWGPAVSLAVVATGNHFLADIAAGVAITVVGYALGTATAAYVAREPRTRAAEPALASG